MNYSIRTISATLAVLLLLLASLPGALAVSYTSTNTSSVNCLTSAKTTYDGKYIETYYKIKECSDPAEYQPLGVHVIKKVGKSYNKFMVLLPGTGLSSEANFGTHDKISLERYLNENVMVAGIDYRETNIDYDPTNNYAYMATMDLPQHTGDIETAIKLVQKKTGILDYELTGHSFGVLVAADYAAKHNSDTHLKKVTGIDMSGPLDQIMEQELIQKEYDNYNATVSDLSEGQTVSIEMLGFAQMIYAAQSDPSGDSGIPNQFVPGTSLTNSEAVLMLLIYTNQLPGNEIYIQGFLAGDMVNGLYYTPEKTIFAAGLQGTVFPTAVS